MIETQRSVSRAGRTARGAVCAGGTDAPRHRSGDRRQRDPQAAAETSATNTAAHAARSSRRALISVVDDDESVREAVDSLLRSAGFEVAVFASAEQLLSWNRLHEVQCLILDVRMPGMTGLELQRRLAAGNSRIPIIFITAHGDEAAKGQALRAGAAAFLRKPFNEQALLTAVRSAL
jgi:CheY-like chemotaxis protein